MNVALWVTAGILAAIYLFAGLGKLFRPYDALQSDQRMAWTNDFSAGTVKFIGSMEVLGAIGLVLPPHVGVAQILVPLAATGLLVVAVGAMAVHARRDETQMVMTNRVFAIMTAIVAIGRFWLEPF